MEELTGALAPPDSRRHRIDLLRSIQSRATRNSLGLPDAFCRFDLLPDSTPSTRRAPDGSETTSEAQVLQPSEVEMGDRLLDRSDLSAALVPISYVEGFPALPSGDPFWSRMDHEPLKAFQTFEAYLAQGNEGARQLFILEADLEGEFAVELKELKDLYVIFYWSDRAKSYDLFRAAEMRKVRSIRALEMENDHYIFASRMMEKVKLQMLTAEFMEDLTPKAAIDLLKTIAQMQRISIGLSPASVPAQVAAPEFGMDNMMRNLAEDGGMTSIGEGTTAHEAEDMVDQVLSDPDSTALAQELILRLDKPNADIEQ